MLGGIRSSDIRQLAGFLPQGEERTALKCQKAPCTSYIDSCWGIVDTLYHLFDNLLTDSKPTMVCGMTLHTWNVCRTIHTAHVETWSEVNNYEGASRRLCWRRVTRLHDRRDRHDHSSHNVDIIQRVPYQRVCLPKLLWMINIVIPLRLLRRCHTSEVANTRSETSCGAGIHSPYPPSCCRRRGPCPMILTSLRAARPA